MEYTELQKASFRQEFTVRPKGQFLGAVPAIAVLILFVIAGEGTAPVLGIPPALAFLIASVVILGYVIFSLRNWRCPACSGYLGKKMNPKFCSKCAAPLQ